MLGDKRPWCAIGSVKSNFGHLESAAGIASLVKAALAVRHGRIPPSINFETPNPQIDFQASPVYVNAELRDWPLDDGPRRAGVSSFGFGGTNCHMIIEQAPAPSPCSEAGRSPRVLTLSARSATSLDELAERYRRHLAGRPLLALADLCYTANTGRVHFEHRLSVCAASTPTLAEVLASTEDTRPGEKVWRSCTSDATPPKIAFLFPGWGAHSTGMARRLFEIQPDFRSALEQCDELLRPLLDQSLLGLLFPTRRQEHTLVEHTVYDQPTLFALTYGLLCMWRAWGVKPDAVLGHGVGEYATACAGGVLGLEDGLRILVERGRLMQAMPNGASAEASTFDVDYWRRHPGQTIRVGNSVDTLSELGCNIFLELGAGSSRTDLGTARRPPKDDELWLAPLAPGADAWSSVAETVARLYVRGVPIDWERFNNDGERWRVPLPLTPFERRRYWVAAATADHVPLSAQCESRLLGERLDVAGSTLYFAADLGRPEFAYLHDHCAADVVRLPMSAYVEVMWAAAHELDGARLVADLEIHDSITLPALGPGVWLHTVVRQSDGSAPTLELYSRGADTAAGAWELRATATAISDTQDSQRERVSIERLRAACTRARLDDTELYERASERGLAYGPAFRGLRSVWLGDGEALGRIELPPEIAVDGYALHPALLDACLQTVLPLIAETQQ